MAQIRVVAERRNYDVRDGDCIGRWCLNLHPIDVRGGTASGSRYTGRQIYECAQRAYHGCPLPAPEYEPDLARDRRQTMKRVTP